MQPLYIPENAVPPEQVRFESIDIHPAPGDRRVRVRVAITPFLSPPSLRVEIHDPDGEGAARVDIIETINHRMSFTMHLRAAPAAGEYTLAAEIYYPGSEPVDRRSLRFSIPAADEAHGE